MIAGRSCGEAKYNYVESIDCLMSLNYSRHGMSQILVCRLTLVLFWRARSQSSGVMVKCESPVTVV